MRVSSVRPVPRSLRSSFAAILLATTAAACGEEELQAVPPGESAAPAVEGCSAAGSLLAPDMPALAPPAGSKLFLRTRADGNQIYSCGVTAAGGWAWTLKAPEARLIDDSCRVLGTHFAGPSWKVTGDGSTVVGRKAAEMAAPVSGAIPWLLIEVIDRSGSPGGTLAPVTHIQRVDTAGGLAPSAGCDAAAAGTEIAVPYVATYLYYRS